MKRQKQVKPRTHKQWFWQSTEDKQVALGEWRHRPGEKPTASWVCIPKTKQVSQRWVSAKNASCCCCCLFPHRKKEVTILNKVSVCCMMFINLPSKVTGTIRALSHLNDGHAFDQSSLPFLTQSTKKTKRKNDNKNQKPTWEDHQSGAKAD